MGCTKPLLELDKQVSSEPVFDKLPSTLILKIFSKLNAGEGTDIRMLSRCAQVSRLWHQLALDGSNWQTVDLFEFQKDVTAKAVKNISLRCGGFLRELSLRGCKNIDDLTIDVFTANCQKLTYLNLSDCKLITDASLISLARNCRNLRAINLFSCSTVTDPGLHALASGCTRLQEVDISFCQKISDAGVEAITSHCLDLKALFLRDTSISDSVLSTIAANSSKLESLNVSYCSISSAGLSKIISSCANLKELYCARCPNVTDSALHALERFTKSALRTLDIAGCNAISDHGVYSLFQSCTGLERIDLEECSGLSDATLLQLAIHCCNIKELTLSHCESITDEGIRHLCSGEMRQSLELIDLDNCPLLTDTSLRLLENCPNLRQLELVDCHHISKTGIDRLERKIPGIKIHSYFAPELEEIDSDFSEERARYCPKCSIQ